MDNVNKKMPDNFNSISIFLKKKWKWFVSLIVVLVVLIILIVYRSLFGGKLSGFFSFKQNQTDNDNKLEERIDELEIECNKNGASLTINCVPTPSSQKIVESENGMNTLPK